MLGKYLRTTDVSYSQIRLELGEIHQLLATNMREDMNFRRSEPRTLLIKVMLNCSEVD
jgi:hypothetical protein